jgi:hypothetical protein
MYRSIFAVRPGQAVVAFLLPTRVVNVNAPPAAPHPADARDRAQQVEALRRFSLRLPDEPPLELDQELVVVIEHERSSAALACSMGSPAKCATTPSRLLGYAMRFSKAPRL